MFKIYRVTRDPEYYTLTIANRLERTYEAKLSSGGFDFEQATRGRRLSDLWDESWEFRPYIEDTAPHPKGLGELAMVGGRLLGTTTCRARDRVQELVGDAAEILRARLEGGGDLWLFNIIRAIDRDALDTLDDSAVFRVNPTKNDVLCGSGFKSCVVESNLHGLRFREVSPTDYVPII